MLTTWTEDLLQRMATGHIDSADGGMLERHSRTEFVAELGAAFPCRFQARQFRQKWEIGLARAVSFKPMAFSPKETLFPIMVLIPVFRHCLFVSGEGESVTGISRVARLVVKPFGKPFRGLSLLTAAGYKLDHAPDGWSLKPVVKRKVKLSEEFLRRRGWRFDFPWAFRP